MTVEEVPLEERVLRIEGLLGLVAGSEFWIVQAEGSRGTRSLAFWGPFSDAEQAATAEVFKPQFGHVVVEVPT